MLLLKTFQAGESLPLIGLEGRINRSELLLDDLAFRLNYGLAELTVARVVALILHRGVELWKAL